MNERANGINPMDRIANHMMADLALRLPGMSLYLMRFWDGQPLRYTLKKKNGDTDQELFVIVFTLVPESEVEKQEKKWGGTGGKKGSSDSKDSTVKGGKQQEEKGSSKFQDEDVD